MRMAFYIIVIYVGYQYVRIMVYAIIDIIAHAAAQDIGIV